MVQIFGPAVSRWLQRPSPGTAGIEYLGEEFHGTCLASVFVGSLPKAYRQQKSWPLILYLHGSGGRGNDPEKLLEMSSFLTNDQRVSDAAVLVIPQCLPKFGWQPEDIGQFTEEACRRYPIDKQRIYLVGYSMGGFGAWRAAAARPELFAAIVPIAGGGSTELATSLVNQPTWAFHGRKDKVVAAQRSTDLVDAVQSAGGISKLTLLPEAGHGIRDRVLLHTPELRQWLFKQCLEQRQSPTVAPSVSGSGIPVG